MFSILFSGSERGKELWLSIFHIKWSAKELLRVSHPRDRIGNVKFTHG